MASILSAGTSTGTALNLTGDTSGNLALQTQNGANTITVPNQSGTLALTSGSNIAATTLSIGGTALGAGNASIMKNRIINGAMVIDQRNAGASVTPTNGQYLVDRWQYNGVPSSKFTAQQNAGSVTPPTGFSNYLGLTSTSSYSISSTDRFFIAQSIEGFNSYDLSWGNANAKTVTLSAWVYSSLTGTFGGSVQNYANNYSYPFTYTISSANTWTQITVTIVGPTSGTWAGATNNGAVEINFAFGVGSTYSGTAGSWSANNYFSATGATSVVGTNGATFYITGVQLEVGSSATGFEYRQYGQELQLCQRYTWVTSRTAGTPLSLGQAVNTNYVTCMLNNPVPMRTAPSISINNQTYFRLTNAANSGLANTSSGSLGTANENITRIDFVSSSTYLTAGNVSALLNSDTSGNNGIITISAEL